LSNERLRAAIQQAGMTVDELAYKVDAGEKTVRRWLAGRTPRPLYRGRVAKALGTTEAELWPELELRVEGRDERAEILAAYAHSGDLAAPDWRPLLQHARHQVDLLDLTLAGILPAAGIAELLREKAQAGCTVRLLLSAPDSAHLVLADNEQGDEHVGLLDIPPSAREAETSLAVAETLVATENIEARTFTAARPNTILRFDDEMLITVHLYATPADQAPLMHLKRHSDHGLFEQFAGHLHALWQDAQPIARQPTPASPPSLGDGERRWPGRPLPDDPPNA
jgi:transcriptional regulator with XRE-family HTH domain